MRRRTSDAWYLGTPAAVAAGGWMALIFGLSSIPAEEIPGTLGPYTALGHFGLYAVLGGLLLLALAPRMRRLEHAAAIATLIASAYGITDEFHQSFVAGRSPDPVDWVVDTLGALVATIVIALLLRHHRHRREDAPLP